MIVVTTLLNPPCTKAEQVEIYGKQYRMSGNSSPEHIKEIAVYVDRKMKEVAVENPQLDSSRLAVLSAVNIADEYLRLKVEYDELVTLFDSN